MYEELGRIINSPQYAACSDKDKGTNTSEYVMAAHTTSPKIRGNKKMKPYFEPERANAPKSEKYNIYMDEARRIIDSISSVKENGKLNIMQFYTSKQKLEHLVSSFKDEEIFGRERETFLALVEEAQRERDSLMEHAVEDCEDNEDIYCRYFQVGHFKNYLEGFQNESHKLAIDIRQIEKNGPEVKSLLKRFHELESELVNLNEAYNRYFSNEKNEDDVWRDWTDARQGLQMAKQDLGKKGADYGNDKYKALLENVRFFGAGGSSYS